MVGGRFRDARLTEVIALPEQRPLLDRIVDALRRHGARIAGIRYGRVTAVIQDGRVVRIETQEGWEAEERPARSG